MPTNSINQTRNTKISSTNSRQQPVTQNHIIPTINPTRLQTISKQNNNHKQIQIQVRTLITNKGISKQSTNTKHKNHKQYQTPKQTINATLRKDNEKVTESTQITTTNKSKHSNYR